MISAVESPPLKSCGERNSKSASRTTKVNIRGRLCGKVLHVVKKIVDILHPDFEVFLPELEWKRRGVEIIALRPVTLRGHATRQRKERSSARRKGDARAGTDNET